MSHPLIVNVASLRKKNKVAASLAIRQLLDNVMMASGIPYNVHEGTDRQYRMINSYLELALAAEEKGSRKETPAIETGKKESALKEAQKLNVKPDEKVVLAEKVITDKDLQ